ncbi:MAG TPA: extracellular solute-binding protein [Firmicutes bacterium]|nr:extracellular solute-binding protein [Bacillota bacterium]
MCKKCEVLHIAPAWLLLLVLTANGIAAAAQTEITHFMYASHNVIWQQYLETMASRFEATTGIKVNIVPSSGNYREKLMTLIAAGVPPDVTDAHPVLAAPLVKQKLFEDLRPYVERDRIPVQEMAPAAIAGTTGPDGYLWGLPVSILPIVTIFNVDLFAQNGLPNPRQLGENWTWDTLRQSARRLTGDVNGDGVTDTWGTSRIHYRWEAQVHQAGTLVYDTLVNPTKSNWNSPATLQAFEFLNELLNVDKVNSPNYQVNDMPQETVGFTVVDGPGTIYLPAVWDVTVPPKGPANRSSRVNPDGFQVIALSEKKEAAWQWVKFLVGSVENQMEMARITQRLPSLRQAMQRYPTVASDLPANWPAYIETAFSPDAYAGYVLFNAEAIDPVVNSHLSNIWNGRAAPATILQQIHEQVSAIMDYYAQQQ